MSSLPAIPNLDEKVGNAWIELRANNYQDAKQQFQAVLTEDPHHIDALFGLGLAHKFAQDTSQARTIWEQALTQVKAEIPADNEPGTRFERLFMLQTMLTQRLEELL